MRSLYAAVNCRRPMRADGAWTSGSGRVGWPGDAPGATATGPFDLSMRELLLRPPYSISSAGRVSFHIDREGFAFDRQSRAAGNHWPAAATAIGGSGAIGAAVTSGAGQPRIGCTDSVAGDC